MNLKSLLTDLAAAREREATLVSAMSVVSGCPPATTVSGPCAITNVSKAHPESGEAYNHVHAVSCSSETVQIISTSNINTVVGVGEEIDIPAAANAHASESALEEPAHPTQPTQPTRDPGQAPGQHNRQEQAVVAAHACLPCGRSTPPTLPTRPTRQVTISEWLADLGHSIVTREMDGAWLGVERIADVIVNSVDLELPGADMEKDWDNEVVWRGILKSLGRRMSQCLRGAKSIIVGDVIVERHTVVTTSPRSGSRISHQYRFTAASIPGPKQPDVTVTSTTPTLTTVVAPEGTPVITPAVGPIVQSESAIAASSTKADAETVAASVVTRINDLGLVPMKFSRARTLAGAIAKGKHRDVFFMELCHALRTGNKSSKDLADQMDAITLNAHWIENTNWQQPNERSRETANRYNNEENDDG